MNRRESVTLPSMLARFSNLALLPILLGFGAPLSAQSKPTKANFERAIAAWLGSDAHEAAKRSAAVEATLAGGKAAMRHLGGIAKKVTPTTAEGTRAEILIRDVALGYLDRESNSGMFYAGQYEALDPLQPAIGRMFLQLVIETPDWFPDNLRVSVVPALRDLFPEAPTEAQREDLREIAIDEDHEPANLRWALACALAEWGDRSLVEPRLRELEESAGKRQNGDELYFVHQLAFLHYQLREYGTAAKVWLEYLRGREAIDSVPPPLDYYNAACSLSLSGRIKDALAELERCATRQVSDEVDESQRVERKLFDHDPELRAVRPTKKFRELVKRAFPPEEGSGR